MKKNINITIILSVLLLAAPSFAKTKVKQDDPYHTSFFEKARLIMTKEEMQIYKHLPDNQSKEEFIEDFWKKRDPSPETEKNEIKEEFELRIAYANRWFNERRGKDRGWDSERGRILLQLGFPDQREFGEMPIVGRSGRLATTQRVGLERWIYHRYGLYLEFIGDINGFGVYKLSRPPALLRTSLDLARARMDLGIKKPKKNFFKYDAAFKDDNIVISIPSKRIAFEGDDGKMNAQFRIDISVYRSYQKIEEIRKDEIISKTEGELLAADNVEIVIPYAPQKKGKYFFDIVVTDKLSSTKYRNSCKTRK